MVDWAKFLKKRYKVKNYTGIEINKKAYDYAKSKNKNFRFFIQTCNYEKNKKVIQNLILFFL